MLFNASDHQLSGDLSGMDLQLPPGKPSIVNPPPSDSKGARDYCYAKFSYLKDGDIEQPFYNSTWRLSDGARSFVFFYREPDHNQLRVHTIRDYLPQNSN